jgi:hypothetical protein
MHELRTAQEGFEAGVDTALGELKRARERTSLDQLDMRRIAEDELKAFASRCKKFLRADVNRKHMPRQVDEALARMDQRLAFKLRHFDNGLLDPSEPDAPPIVKNSIAIDTMYGGAVQQGTRSSNQTVTTTFNVNEVGAVLDALEVALRGVSIEGDAQAELKAELETMRAQLKKPNPSMVILQEAGKSLKKIVEDAAIAAASPVVQGLLLSLMAALGIGLASGH